MQDDIADLRSVAMHDDKLVPLSDQGYETACGGIGDVLLGNRRCFTLTLQGVSAEGDDNSFSLCHLEFDASAYKLLDCIDCTNHKHGCDSELRYGEWLLAAKGTHEYIDHNTCAINDGGEK